MDTPDTAAHPTQQEKALRFKALHEAPELLVLPNPWDAGSAKLLAHAGATALATTSAGLACALGLVDGHPGVDLEVTLANARQIVLATGLPVAADLENGYGDAPEACARTIERAAAAGLVGASIEDATGQPTQPIYPIELAVERIRAAVAAARALPFPFMLAARAENYLHGRPDLGDTIRRLAAYAEAGADVLYAPGLTTREQIKAVVAAVAPKPVNVLVGSPALALSLDELQQLGVRRASVGSALARAAYGAFFQAAADLLQRRDLAATQRAMPFAQLDRMLVS